MEIKESNTTTITYTKEDIEALIMADLAFKGILVNDPSIHAKTYETGDPYGGPTHSVFNGLVVRGKRQ